MISQKDNEEGKLFVGGKCADFIYFFSIFTKGHARPFFNTKKTHHIIYTHSIHEKKIVTQKNSSNK